MRTTVHRQPTVSAPSQPLGIDTTVIGERRLVLGLDTFRRLDFAQHKAIHGAMGSLTRQALEQLCEEVNLLGRGGAGFPVATKLRSLPARRVRAVVVNGSESEPASWKDRALMRRTPHLIVDGALAVADSVGAREVMVVVHDAESSLSLRLALRERPDGNRVRIMMSPGRFVSGEARAVIHAAEDEPALPNGRRILPTTHGYRNGPTFLSNAETFAQLALLVRRGRQYADTGLASEPGTMLLTLGGAVARPAVVEVPIGIPLAVVLAAAGVAEDATILLGGYHGSFVQDTREITLSRASAAAHGASLGAGVVLALGADTCPLAEVETVTRWLASQSAGQCGPCVFGLPSLADDLGRLRRGDLAALPDLRRHVGVIPGRGACAHPDGVTRFVASAIQTFGRDIGLHLEHGTCGRPGLGQLPLPPPVVSAS